MHSTLSLITLLTFVSWVKCNDITLNTFGALTDGMPAAFGDFNSDELTDVFVLRDNGKTIEILLANDEEPLLRTAKPNPLRCTFTNPITSVVPGDFDGDALMDILVTTIKRRTDRDGSDGRALTSVHVIWGGASYLNCSNESSPVLNIIGQPLAIDYNQDMIIDLFGLSAGNVRTFWIFNKTRGQPEEIRMEGRDHAALSQPHSHAFLGLYFHLVLG